MDLNIKNLTLLKDKLLAVQKNEDLLRRFNMRSWGVALREDGTESYTALPDLTVSCGSSGCALGWGTTVPELGLKFFRSRYGNVGITDDFDRASSARGSGAATTESFESARRVFGLSVDEADWLFAPMNYRRERAGHIQPQDVADRIDRLIRGEEIDL